MEEEGASVLEEALDEGLALEDILLLGPMLVGGEVGYRAAGRILLIPPMQAIHMWGLTSITEEPIRILPLGPGN